MKLEQFKKLVDEMYEMFKDDEIRDYDLSKLLRMIPYGIYELITALEMLDKVYIERPDDDKRIYIELPKLKRAKYKLNEEFTKIELGQIWLEAVEETEEA